MSEEQSPQDEFNNMQDLIGHAMDDMDSEGNSDTEPDSTGSEQSDTPDVSDGMPVDTDTAKFYQEAEKEAEQNGFTDDDSESSVTDTPEDDSSEAESSLSSESSKSPSASAPKSQASVTNESSSRADSISSSTSTNASYATNVTDSVDAQSASQSSSRKSTSASSTSRSTTNSEDMALQARLARISSAKADDFMASHEIDGKYDPPVVWLMSQMLNSIRDYIKVATSNYENHERPDKKTFKAQMERLRKIPANMSEAMIGVWAEYNRSFLILKRQIDDLNDEHDTEKEINPPKETHLLIRWVRKGVPTQMEKDFYRLDKVANDPRFEEFLRSNNISSKVPVPKTVAERTRSLHAENKARENSNTAVKQIKKGGHQKNGDK